MTHTIYRCQECEAQHTTTAPPEEHEDADGKAWCWQCETATAHWTVRGREEPRRLCQACHTEIHHERCAIEQGDDLFAANWHHWCDVCEDFRETYKEGIPAEDAPEEANPTP